MKPEPNALDALAHVGIKIAEYGAYTLISGCILAFGIATGWLG